MILGGGLWISEFADRQTFASDSLSITVCTWFDYLELSGKTHPGTMSPTLPRARFEIIDNRAGVGAPGDSISPPHVAEGMKQFRRTSGAIRTGWNRAKFAQSTDDFGRTAVRWPSFSRNWKEACSRGYYQSRKTVLNGCNIDFTCEIGR
jgi:hypothetical protein